MYDWPEVHSRSDAFWAAIRSSLHAQGVSAPETLSRPNDIHTPWTDPDLVLGQTCGLPYVSGRCGSAILVAQPVYGVEGAGDGTYSSALVVRTDAPDRLLDFAGCVAAINDAGSQSGCNALVDAFQQTGITGSRPLFGRMVITGAHRASAMRVAEGEADIAAIDAVAWALFAKYEPAHHQALKVLAWTRPMPALPFITTESRRPLLPKLRRALEEAIRVVSGPEIPVAFRPAKDADYGPIREMAASVSAIALH